MEITYRLLHNLDTRYSTNAYTPGQRLADGYIGEIAFHPEALFAAAEAIFLRHNADDRPDGQSAPSLSVGDVVILGEIALSVDRIGWTKVTVNPDDLLGVPYLEAVRD
jgi:hypothetical protein